jgi:hypothetical protein
MRNRIAVGLGLVAVILAIVGPPFVALSLRPYKPQLRVGMSLQEAFQVPGNWSDLMIPEYSGWEYYWCDYESEPDWLGNRYRVDVRFDTGWRTKHQDDHGPFGKYWKVNRWKVVPLPRTRPSWLDTAMKWVGW